MVAAFASAGSCTVAGQAVTCTISGLAPGASVPIGVIVSAPSVGTYADQASVAAGLPDPTPADNLATATLTVTAPPIISGTPLPPPAPKCTVVSLAGAPLAVAKGVITALGCKVGKVTSKRSKKVAKGLVISTTPGAGSYAANTTVDIVKSSGKPKKKHKKKKH